MSLSIQQNPTEFLQQFHCLVHRSAVAELSFWGRFTVTFQNSGHQVTYPFSELVRPMMFLGVSFIDRLHSAGSLSALVSRKKALEILSRMRLLYLEREKQLTSAQIFTRIILAFHKFFSWIFGHSIPERIDFVESLMLSFSQEQCEQISITKYFPSKRFGYDRSIQDGKTTRYVIKKDFFFRIVQGEIDNAKEIDKRAGGPPSDTSDGGSRSPFSEPAITMGTGSLGSGQFAAGFDVSSLDGSSGRHTKSLSQQSIGSHT
ncbi:MAG: hypothetical protein AAGI90_00365 [Chlamydiota bacterium]